MHGAVHDWVVLHTVKNGENMPSAEEMYGGLVREYVTYPYISLKEQPVFHKILDIGSLDICGSQKEYDFINRGPKWRTIVGCEEFIGLDIMPGNGVDLVADGHSIPFQEDEFDLVICMNMLEHDSDPQQTIKEAFRVAKVGQPVILTTVNQNWAPHPQLGGGNTETFNRITVKQFSEWIEVAGFLDPEIVEWNDNLFCYAVKDFYGLSKTTYTDVDLQELSVVPDAPFGEAKIVKKPKGKK